MNEVAVTILVEPGFVPTELALVQDVLRIASRLSQDAQFRVRICTSCGEDLVEGLGGLLVRATAITAERIGRPHYLVVLGGFGVRQSFASLCPWVRRFERNGCGVLLLSDAASEWKRLNPEASDVTTHWENHQLLHDTGVIAGMTLPLYAQTNRITSAAGMIATADVVLSTIVAPLSIQLAHATSQVLLMHAIRTPDTCQPRSEHDSLQLRQAKLKQIIAMMEDNIETPLRIATLADAVGLSIRQLERRFKKATGSSPNVFYRSLRLKRGRALVEQSDMAIIEIALCCGFSGSSSFSRIFAEEYGITPARMRSQLVASAQRPVFFKKPTHETQNAYPLRLSGHPPPSLELINRLSKKRSALTRH